MPTQVTDKALDAILAVQLTVAWAVDRLAAALGPFAGQYPLPFYNWRGERWRW